jgi:2,3-bisphosphoglycerate-dependent phosphoglycerate mutase
MATTSPSHEPLYTTRVLRFVRHGATDLNLARLRCGGDVDVPLAELGHQQAAATARCIANLRPPVGVIVTSDLQRTRQTADIIAAALKDWYQLQEGKAQAELRVVVQPLFAERHLGDWNGLPKEAHQAALDAGQTPPGGESKKAFKDRIVAALAGLHTLWPQQPLLVSSQGVARVLGELAGLPQALRVANAQLVEFDLTQALRAPASAMPMEEML